jgi:hypothetical protein
VSGQHTGAAALLALVKLGETPPDRAEAVAALRAMGEDVLADALARGGLSATDVVALLPRAPVEVRLFEIRSRLRHAAIAARRELSEALGQELLVGSIADVARALDVDRRQMWPLVKALGPRQT